MAISGAAVSKAGAIMTDPAPAAHSATASAVAANITTDSQHVAKPKSSVARTASAEAPSKSRAPMIIVGFSSREGIFII